MSRPAKLVVDRLIRDMQERPDDFSIDEHVLTDKAKGFDYWIANTRADAEIYRPYQMKFGLIQSYRFHAALDKLKAWKNLNAKTPLNTTTGRV